MRFQQSFPAILITGPRQIGKTSLLRHLFPQHTYVCFDAPSLARQAEESPEMFLENIGEKPVILDEIQYVPSLFRHLKANIDQNPASGRFLLTGSQAFPLMQGVGESLAGRCGIVEMQSLSYEELLAFNPAQNDMQYIVTGGYPALYAGNIRNPADWYGSYVSTYLERDVRNLQHVGNLRDFERLLRAAAIRVGQLLSYSDLARDVGVAVNTAKQWVSVLQASGQILLLEPYHRNITKRLIKSPKLYFMDSGLACHLTGINDLASLLNSPMLGALWENHVITQWLRFFCGRGEKVPLWFWRTVNGHEVDLVIEHGGRFVAIECKATEEASQAGVSGLKSFGKEYGEQNMIARMVACRTPHAHALPDEDIWAVNGSVPSAAQRIVEAQAFSSQKRSRR